LVPLEIDHIPQYDSACAHVERLEYDLFEVFGEQPLSFVKRPWEVAAVGARQKTWQR